PAVVKGHSWHPQPILLHSAVSGSDKLERFTETGANTGSLGVFEAKHLIRLMQSTPACSISSEHNRPVDRGCLHKIQKPVVGCLSSLDWRPLSPLLSGWCASPARRSICVCR